MCHKGKERGDMERWHSMTVRQVMEKLDSGPEGLSDGEAARRLEREGSL